MSWCNAGAFCVQQYPPSVSFAACSKEAGALCVCQPSSLAAFVKVNKLVCSGTALSYGGERKSRKEEIVRRWQEAGLGEGGGTEDGGTMNSCVCAWAVHCPFLHLHPFPSRATPLYCHSSVLHNGECTLHKSFGCRGVSSTDCSDAHSEVRKWHLPGKITAAGISSRFPSTHMELNPPFKISLSLLVVDSAPLLLLSIYYPCQGGGPDLPFK